MNQELLKDLQSYPMFIKVRLSEDRVREACREHELFFSFSGGKDSEVALHIGAKILKTLGYKSINAVYCCTGLDYLSVRAFVKDFCKYIEETVGIKVNLITLYPEVGFVDVIKEYGYPIISKEVSQKLYEARIGLERGNYQSSVDKMLGRFTDKNGKHSSYNCDTYSWLLNAPFRISNRCCRITKERPSIKYEKKSGMVPVIATLTEESRLRRSAWLKAGTCNVFDAARPSSHPFSFWKTQDILQYIYENNLPVASAYGKVAFEDGKYYLTGCERTGCLFCMYGITQDPTRFLRLKELEPERTKFVLGGGEYDAEGYWVPNKEGLGYKFVIDWLNSHSDANILY